MAPSNKIKTVILIGPENVGKKTLLSRLDAKGKPSTFSIKNRLFKIENILNLPDESDEKYSENNSKIINEVRKTDIVLFMADIVEDYRLIAERFLSLMPTRLQKSVILINKLDLMDNTCSAYDIEEAVSTLTSRTPTIVFSAKNDPKLDKVKKQLLAAAK